MGVIDRCEKRGVARRGQMVLINQPGFKLKSCGGGAGMFKITVMEPAIERRGLSPQLGMELCMLLCAEC